MAAKKPVTVADVVDMSVPERIQLVEDIWDSIGAEADDAPLTAEERAIIDSRLRSMREHPEAEAPLETVLARIRSRR